MRCTGSELVADRGLQQTLLVRVATADESDTLREDSWRRQLRVVRLMLLSQVLRATGESGALTGDGWHQRKRGGRKLCQVEPSGKIVNIIYSCGHKSVHWLYQWPCRCDPKRWLNYWGRVTHICVSKLSTIGWRQAIIWSNAEILLFRTFGTNFSEIYSKFHTLHSRKCIWKCRLPKWRPLCLVEDELKYSPPTGVVGLWVDKMKPGLLCRYLHLYLRERELLHIFQSQLRLCTSCTHDDVIHRFNRLFRARSKKTSKLRVTGLCGGIHRWPREFPAQRASNEENVSFWLRYHAPLGPSLLTWFRVRQQSTPQPIPDDEMAKTNPTMPSISNTASMATAAPSISSYCKDPINGGCISLSQDCFIQTHTDGLVQKRRNSSALRLSCISQSI